MKGEWIEEFPYAITVSDRDGKIIDLNSAAADTFKKWGGKELIGRSLTDCHNANSNNIINRLMSDGVPNIYTIEKEGRKKLICQSPWFIDGKVMGLVEISIPLPETIDHKPR